MGSSNPWLDLYDPKMLEAFGQAFDATWMVLQTRGHRWAHCMEGQ